ncbi:hypothetical protein HBNCFIEN_01543 [Legionella sp. PC997]|nr:hypothetical protein HBNCFIEN_01543 [Legionella sp. PC997]
MRETLPSWRLLNNEMNKLRDLKYLLVICFYVLLLLAFLSIDSENLIIGYDFICLFTILFIVDFLTGIVHFFLDYYPLKTEIIPIYNYRGDRKTERFNYLKKEAFRNYNIIDKISYNFKIHHNKPMHLSKKIYTHLCFETIVPSLLLVCIVFLLKPNQSDLKLILSSTALFICNIQYIHTCVHGRETFVFVRSLITWAQKYHIIYPFKIHAEHHKYISANFCLLTGWGNVVLNPIIKIVLQKTNIRERSGLFLSKY